MVGNAGRPQPAKVHDRGEIPGGEQSEISLGEPVLEDVRSLCYAVSFLFHLVGLLARGRTGQPLFDSSPFEYQGRDRVNPCGMEFS